MARRGGAVIRAADGVLSVPEAARGLIVLAPPVHDAVADGFAGSGFATLRLAGAEASLGALSAAAARVRARPQVRHLAIGYFGTGRGAPAVLDESVEGDAIVVAGAHGEPSAERLAEVTAPSLLIAAGEDPEGLRWARAARDHLQRSQARLVVVAGATRGFSEHGALEQVTHLAGGWFGTHLAGGPSSARRDRAGTGR